MRTALSFLTLAFTVSLLASGLAMAQAGAVAGTVKDSGGAVLPGATVKLTPGDASSVSDSQGQFNISDVARGVYTVTVNYVGFVNFTGSVTAVAGQTARVNPVLKVATATEAVLVTAERAHGEAEAINEEKIADNILNVLPSEVITSLPNANVADAVGRLPGVTLERDEGEGKYVQIRGTEPRLANLTIDGVEVPSPEGGVRQVKLDVLPADLVESVQINKTLQSNMNGAAIGGSVNLVTRKAADRPSLSLYSSGGFTPIDNTRTVYDFGGIAGMRFGAEKRVGAMVSGSFDYNGRGIDDIEPVPSAILNPDGSFAAYDITAPAFRQYLYDRKRYGFGGSVDYRLSENSNLSVHSLYSDFKDYGDRYEYVFGTNDGIPLPGPNIPGPFTTERRNPDFQVASLSVGANHVFGTSLLNWQLAAARSRMLNPIGGGESHTVFNYTETQSNCQYVASATTNPYLPAFSPACYSEAYDPAGMQLNQIQDSAHGQTAQLNLEGTISYAKNYHIGSHSSTFETGFYIRNAHKFDDSYEIDWCPIISPTTPAPPLASQFLSGFTNNNYYNGHYPYGPGISWEKVQSYFAVNRSAFTNDPNNQFSPCAQNFPKGANSNNFDLVERVTAGYVMDSLDFSRFRIVGGVRFEGTQDDTLSLDTTVTPNTVTFPGHGFYISYLPSVSVRARLDSHDNSALRFVYARGLSRPDPSFLTTATSLDNSTSPPTLTVGNPALKPEHGNNFDVLYERYLTPLGVIQAGFFYKSLTDPIVSVLAGPQAHLGCPIAACYVNTAGNAGTAHITGVEVAFQQHLTYLPRFLSGFGVSGNYSYATSQAHNLPGRSDSPPLLRQAPNTWNISPTYDRGRVSLRTGLAYNGANIYSYFFTDVAPGGIHGPFGDYTLFSHFQVDAQGSVYLGKGFTAIASGLNLNNEVFGFYYGSGQYWTQREYYKPTYTFGLRWDLRHEK